MTLLVILPRSAKGALLATPALDALIAGFEGCRVVGVLSAVSMELFRFDDRFHAIAVRPDVQPLLGWGELGRFATQVEQEHGPFEWVVNLEESAASAWLALRFGAKNRATLKAGGMPPFGWRATWAGEKNAHRSLGPLELVWSLGEKRPATPPRLSIRDLQPTGKMIGICATGQTGSRFDWGAHHWAECALNLSEQAPLRLFAQQEALGGLERMESVLAYNEVRAYESYGSERSLYALLLAIAPLRLFVGGEGLLSQMAMALGVPTVVIYGPQEAGHDGPFNRPRAKAIFRTLECRPCRRCTDPNHSCLSTIAPSEVVDLALTLLDR